jgi:hypothetical protein
MCSVHHPNDVFIYFGFLCFFLQSFVKKVTARVTNLLSQPAWLSKWFTASVDSDSGSDDDDDDDTANVHTHGIKRAKIQLNQQFPPNSFEVSPVVNDQGMSEELKSILVHYSVIG